MAGRRLPTVRARPSPAARSRHRDALASWQHEHGARAHGVPQSVDTSVRALAATLEAANTDTYLAQMNRIARTVGLAARGGIRAVPPERAVQIAQQATQSARSIVATQVARGQRLAATRDDHPTTADAAYRAWNAGQQALIGHYEAARASTAAMADMVAANPDLEGAEWIEPDESSGDEACEGAIARGRQPLGTFTEADDGPPFHPNCVHYVCQSYGTRADPSSLWIPGARDAQDEDGEKGGARTMVDYFGAELSLKTVSIPQRLIAGYAAHHHSIDRVRDIIDPGASAKAVARIKSPSEIGCFIGHNAASLPVGIPQRIEATPQGLYTETYILKGPDGDNLLAVAKDLQEHGQSLGMSIGYKTHDSALEHTAHGRVRRLLDYALKEYSFASSAAIANPNALVHSVKSRKGPGMQYRVAQQVQENRWLVYCDADADGDEDDNRLVGTYDSAEMANAVVVALRQEQEQDDQDDEDDGDEDDSQDERPQAPGKTLSLLERPMTKADFDALTDSGKMALHAELLEAGAL